MTVCSVKVFRHSNIIIILLEYTVAYEGECNHCNVACIEIYDPVCTVDADGNEKTWGNSCELESYNCRYPNNRTLR